MLVLVPLARAQQHDGLVIELPRALHRGQHDGGPAIGHERTIQEPQRVRDRTALEHLVDGDRLPHLRARMETRMVPTGHRDLGHGARRETVFMEVGVRHQRVVTGDGAAVGPLELRVTGRRLGDESLVAAHPGLQAVGHRDHDHFADPAHDRERGLIEHRERRATAGPGTHAVAREDLEGLGHGLRVIHARLRHAVAGDQPVDVLLAQASVRDRSEGGLGAEPRRALAGHLADLGIGDPGDGDSATQVHQDSHRTRAVPGVITSPASFLTQRFNDTSPAAGSTSSTSPPAVRVSPT